MSQQTRAARSKGSSDDSSACLLNIGREACGVAGAFQREAANRATDKEEWKE